jgi:hypothetical protein
MSDFAIEVTNVTGGTDFRWLRSSHGVDSAVTGTYDLATGKGIAPLRDADTGVVPSGVLVGQITATGLYGVWDKDATDGRQVLAGVALADVNVINNRFVVLPSGKAPFAVLKHGILSRKFLPVEAQRTVDESVATTAQFVFVD